MTMVSQTLTLGPEKIRRLREEHYNATVAAVVKVHADLRILRVTPDADLPPMEAGQYTTLGLGNWEPRVAGADVEQLDSVHLPRLAKRAYSISCSLLDPSGALRRIQDFPYLEFYVALVRHGESRPPALTPRLFALGPGDRLFVSPHAAGHYTLAAVQPNHDIFFFATGTGEAPHNAMLAELLSRDHPGRIVNAVSERRGIDAAYWPVHNELMRRFANYQYRVLTTREPENLNPAAAGFVGKQYLQDQVRSGTLERDTGVLLQPEKTHVFLCGSPAMIGQLPRADEGSSGYASGSMLDELIRRGFTPDQPQQTGNVHFERYW